jgi:hypothetical protein
MSLAEGAEDTGETTRISKFFLSDLCALCEISGLLGAI